MKIHALLGFVGILRETQKIFFKNVKLMASITLLILSLQSLFFLSNVFSTKPLLTNLTLNASLLQLANPGSPEFFKLLSTIKDDLRIVAGVEWIFILAASITSLFSLTTIILASRLTIIGENISLKDLLLRVAKSLKRPVVTWFYKTLFDIGYIIFLIWMALFPLMLIIGGQFFSSATPVAIGLVLAAVFYSYLAVVWILALVVSVMEESYGIDALAKAGQLAKGLRLSGFFLTLLFEILCFTEFQVFRLINTKQSAAIRLPIMLLAVNFSSLVNMFVLMAFTVFYYECKKNHGEEIELQGSLGYTKIPTTALLNADIP